MPLAAALCCQWHTASSHPQHISIQSIAQSPESGSVWEFKEAVASSPRVSFFKVRGFPNHLVFYSTMPDRIRILRLLHAARDITHLALANDSPG